MVRWCGVPHGEANSHTVIADPVWLIAEDARDDVAEVLRNGGAEVTVTAGNGDAERSDPPASVVVISSTKQGHALVETVKDLSTRGLAILVCDEASPSDVRAVLRTGVRGIVLRRQVPQALLPVLGAVLSGQVCVPTDDVIGAARPILSIREKQVIGLVAMGLMNVEIAERLYLAESTVKSHLSSAFAKLGVRSRHEAAELLLNPASGLGLGILSLDADARPTGAAVADLR
jgi:DNA-binding NarL/FixJ family response regulator